MCRRRTLIKKNLRAVLVAASAGCLIILSACSNNIEQDSHMAHPETDPQQAEDPKTPLGLNEQIALARKDLAQRQGADASPITLVAARHVTWRSGALGCPGPGMSYTQALVPGVLIILQAGNENFSYHAENNGVPFYCPSERIEVPASMEAEDLA
jgi:hypothetical protein